MKTPIPEINSRAYVINDGLDLVEETISKLEDAAKETIGNETRRNTNLKMNRVSLRIGQASSGLMFSWRI